MPYLVAHKNHEQYGNVIEISRSEEGLITPYKAYLKAKDLKNKFTGKIRFLIDQQILVTANQVEIWARDEYQALPKCQECAKILAVDVFTHQFSDCLFCSQVCADKNFEFEIKKFEEDDIDLDI